MKTTTLITCQMTKDTPCDTVEESEEIIRDLTEKRMAREADSCSINVEMEAYNGS